MYRETGDEMADKERQNDEMQPESKPPMTVHTGGKADTSLPLELQGAIGKQLKQVYGQMLAEPLPDKFTQLLNKLSKSDSDS